MSTLDVVPGLGGSGYMGIWICVSRGWKVEFIMVTQESVILLVGAEIVEDGMG